MKSIYTLERGKQNIIVKNVKSKKVYKVLMGQRFAKAPKFDGKTYSTIRDGQPVCRKSVPLSRFQTANDLHIPVACTCKDWIFRGLTPVKPRVKGAPALVTQASLQGCKHMAKVKDHIFTYGIKSLPDVSV